MPIDINCNDSDIRNINLNPLFASLFCVHFFGDKGRYKTFVDLWLSAQCLLVVWGYSDAIVREHHTAVEFEDLRCKFNKIVESEDSCLEYLDFIHQCPFSLIANIEKSSLEFYTYDKECPKSSEFQHLWMKNVCIPFFDTVWCGGKVDCSEFDLEKQYYKMIIIESEKYVTILGEVYLQQQHALTAKDKGQNFNSQSYKYKMIINGIRSPEDFIMYIPSNSGPATRRACMGCIQLKLDDLDKRCTKLLSKFIRNKKLTLT